MSFVCCGGRAHFCLVARCVQVGGAVCFSILVFVLEVLVGMESNGCDLH